MKHLQKIYFFLLVAWVLGHPVKAQGLSPLQAGHYFPGVINLRDMAHPPPGMFFLMYNTYLWTHTYVDRHGNKLKEVNLSEVHPKLPDINIDMNIQSFSAVPVIAWASKFKILGATWEPMIIFPGYSYSDTHIFSELGFGAIDTTITSSKTSKVSGFGDLMVQPVGLSWTVPNFDFMLTYAFYAPTGRYKTGADDNIGLGYWTHQFQGFAYYYPVQDQSTALLLGLTYEINSKIIDADETPGSRLTLEWGISQYLSERFALTIQGSNNWQVGDDSGDDVWWDPSVHDRKSSLLFSANYWVVENKLFFALKYGFDFAVRQRFDNNMLFFNIIYIPGIFTGKQVNR